jgi:hypothetical protein
MVSFLCAFLKIDFFIAATAGFYAAVRYYQESVGTYKPSLPSTINRSKISPLSSSSSLVPSAVWQRGLRSLKRRVEFLFLYTIPTAACCMIVFGWYYAPFVGQELVRFVRKSMLPMLLLYFRFTYGKRFRPR